MVNVRGDADVAVRFALSIIERRTGTRFSVAESRPDEDERQRPAVDYLASDASGGVIAIEHTRTEAYVGQIADYKLMGERFDPVCELANYQLPMDSVFDLTIRPGTANQLRPSQQQDIANWIVAVGPTLGAPPQHSAWTSGIGGSPAICLSRWPLNEYLSAGPRIRYRIEFDDNSESTLDRLGKAFRDKFPKLDAARVLHSARETLLVLESRDIDPWVLAGGLQERARTTGGVPDHIVLVICAWEGTALCAYVYRDSGIYLTRPAYLSPKDLESPLSP